MARAPSHVAVALLAPPRHGMLSFTLSKEELPNWAFERFLFFLSLSLFLMDLITYCTTVRTKSMGVYLCIEFRQNSAGMTTYIDQ